MVETGIAAEEEEEEEEKDERRQKWFFLLRCHKLEIVSRSQSLESHFDVGDDADDTDDEDDILNASDEDVEQTRRMVVIDQKWYYILLNDKVSFFLKPINEFDREYLTTFSRLHEMRLCIFTAPQIVEVSSSVISWIIFSKFSKIIFCIVFCFQPQHLKLSKKHKAS